MLHDRQVRANRAIEESRVLDELSAYSPEVVSTILVGLDTAASDVDILCAYGEQEAFAGDFDGAFSARCSFDLSLRRDHVVGRFRCGEFIFEVHASPIPVRSRAAYRHFRMMQRLVAVCGPRLGTRVRHLKERGLKTEPAICRVLGLSGEPYTAVLDLENWTDRELERRVAGFL